MTTDIILSINKRVSYGVINTSFKIQNSKNKTDMAELEKYGRNRYSICDYYII